MGTIMRKSSAQLSIFRCLARMKGLRYMRLDYLCPLLSDPLALDCFDGEDEEQDQNNQQQISHSQTFPASGGG